MFGPLNFQIDYIFYFLSIRLNKIDLKDEVLNATIYCFCSKVQILDSVGDLGIDVHEYVYSFFRLI